MRGQGWGRGHCTIRGDEGAGAIVLLEAMREQGWGRGHCTIRGDEGAVQEQGPLYY